MKWQLVIGEENECCGYNALLYEKTDFMISFENYKAGQIVFLWNNTLQILIPRGEHFHAYEIDLDRSDELDWLDHLSHKTWATEEMIRAVASAARRIGKIKIRTIKKSVYEDCWSKDREEKAVEHIKSRDLLD